MSRSKRQHAQSSTPQFIPFNMHGTIHLGPRHLPLLLHLTQTRFVSDCPSRSSPFLAVTGMNGPCFNTAEARYPRRPSYSVHVRRFPLRCFDKLNRPQIKLNEHIYASLSIHRDNAKRKKKKKKRRNVLSRFAGRRGNVFIATRKAAQVTRERSHNGGLFCAH